MGTDEELGSTGAELDAPPDDAGMVVEPSLLSPDPEHPAIIKTAATAAKVQR